MANRFTDYDPKERVSNYVPLPLEFMAQALAQKQNTQDKAILEQDTYLNKTWKRFDFDAPKARELKAKHDASVESFSNKDFNNPQVRNDWSRAKRQFANDFGQDGEAGAQEQNYNQYIAKDKELTSKLDKSPDQGGISAATKNYIMEKAYNDLKAKGGTGEQGQFGYNQIQFETGVANPDIGKQVLDATVNWKSDTNKNGYYIDSKGKTQWLKHGSIENEGISELEIKNAILPLIMQRPENRAYAEQQTNIAFYGKDDTTDGYISYKPGYLKDEMYKSFFTAPVEASMARLGFLNTSRDEKWTTDQEYLKGIGKEGNSSPTPFQHYPGALKTNEKVENVELIPGVPVKDLFNVDKDGKISWRPISSAKDSYVGYRGMGNIKGQEGYGAKASGEKRNEITNTLINQTWKGTPFEEMFKTEGFTNTLQKYLNAITEANNKDNFSTELKNVDTDALTYEVTNIVSPESSSFVSKNGSMLNLSEAAASYGLKITNEEFSALDKTKQGFSKGGAGVQITKLSTPAGSYIMNVRDSKGSKADIPVQSSYEMKNHLEPVNEMFNRMNSGKIGEDNLSDGTRIKTSWKENKQNGKIEYDSKVYDELNADQKQRLGKLIIEQHSKLPAEIKKSKQLTIDYLEYANPGLEVMIDENGVLTFEKYLSLPEYSDFKTQELINSGYLPKSREYKEQENVEQIKIDFEE